VDPSLEAPWLAIRGSHGPAGESRNMDTPRCAGCAEHTDIREGACGEG